MKWPYIAALISKQWETSHQRTGDSCHARWHHHLSKKEEYKGWEDEAMARLEREEDERAQGSDDEKAKKKQSKAEEIRKLKGESSIVLNVVSLD